MREIKFRGKRVDNGKWVYGYYAKLEKNGSETHYIYTGFLFSLSSQYYEVDLDTIGQYICAKDANGKEIYHGDIVEIKRRPNKGDYTRKSSVGDIIYNTSTASFRIRVEHYGKSIGESNTRKFTPDEVVEVIGNKFDNKELLNNN